MKKILLKMTALCLTVVLIFSGCANFDWGSFTQPWEPELVAFQDMEYTRPDPDALERKQQAVIDGIEAGDDAKTLMDKVFSFYEDYHTYYTGYALANIHYFRDLTDIYWEKEYDYCTENSARVDAALDQMLYALADCPIKEELEAEEYFGEGFFDSFEGDSIWDETFTALAEQEAVLEGKYYELSAQAAEMDVYSEAFYNGCGKEMAQLYVDLIKVRQQMAAQAGYDDYLTFAYEVTYYRDYTPQQTMEYLDDIQKQLVPLYKKADLNKYWNANKTCTEEQVFHYVRDRAQAMGGTVADAFTLLETAGLYDITYSDKKYDASFEIYISNYYEPFVFVNPTGRATDQLTFTHEFGHFCNDYASYGSQVGIDVAEFFSQGLEYLSLCYGEKNTDLSVMKMMDCLFLYVEQSAYASFEHQAHKLEGEELTVERLCALYEQVGKDYGLDIWDWDGRSFVLVPHFFTSPMYIISYVVSNDAALQLYQLEVENPGEGLKKYQDNLATMEGGFLAFVTSAELSSPFTEGRVETVRKTLEEVLK